jgi:hypothetical protein
MTQDLMQSAAALADALAEENQALGGLELGRAVTLLDTKLCAVSAFIAAEARAASAPQGARPRRQLVEAAVLRLRDLAEENKRLLERAIIVQGRVIGSIVAALPRIAAGTRHYGATGALAGSRLRPMALSARV